MHASQRPGSLLVTVLNAAAILLASAISGAAVALQLASPSPSLDYDPMRVVLHAETQAPPGPEALGDATTLVASSPPPVAQPKDSTTVRPASLPATCNAVAPMPAPVSPASPSIPERELTFAWGYAQRHPEAQLRYRELRITQAVARSIGEAADRNSNSELRLGAGRQPASNVSSQAQRVFAQFDAGPQQAFAYAEPETARRISFRLKRARTPGASFTRSRPCSSPQF
jgi:hypothetical protein